MADQLLLRTRQELRDLRHKLTEFYDNVPLGYLTISQTGRIVEANLRAAEMLESSKEKLFGQALISLVAPADRIVFDLHRQQLFTQQNRAQWELRLRRYGGGIFHAQMEATPVPTTGSNDNVAHLVISDITHRKQMELALQKSEERYRRVSELVFDYAYEFRIGLDGTLTCSWVTDAFERITGYTLAESEAVGGWQQLIHPDDGSVAQQRAARLLSGERDVSEFRLITRSGVVRWIRDHAQPIWDAEEGRIVAISGAAQDITAQKSMRDTLNTERNLFRTLIDVWPDYIYVKDIDGRFIITNAAHARTFGADTPAHVVGKFDVELYPFPQAKQYRQDDLDVLATGEPLINRIEQVTNRLGEVRWHITTKAPYRNLDGEVVGIIGISRDITEEKESDDEKADLFQAVSAQRERLRALTERLAEAQEIERKQLARELHDAIGQNLTALGLNLNILSSYLSDLEPAQSRLRDSLALVEQMTDSVRDVMADLRPPVLDDYGLIAALRWYAKRSEGWTAFKIDVNGSEPEPRLAPTVENTLFRITQEAVTNATKYSQASLLTISLSSTPQAVELMIVDDGVGFEISQVKTPSDRLTGWGLTAMTERAEAIGVQFALRSGPGQGTTIHVEVPR